MQDLDIATIWLIAGAVLMVLELLLPGGIVFFLGLSASLVSLFLYTGLIDGWIQAFTTWFVASLALVFGMRGVVQKILPAQVDRSNTDEDLDAYGHAAEVSTPIPAGGTGRIRFRGSEWDARNYHDDEGLEPGTSVRIVFRENLTWVVEKVSDQG